MPSQLDTVIPNERTPFMTEYPAFLPLATSPVEAAVSTALDCALDCDHPGAAIDMLRHSLAEARRASHPDEWRRLVERHVRRHPALRVVHEDPLIERCYTKPRGYPGD